MGQSALKGIEGRILQDVTSPIVECFVIRKVASQQDHKVTPAAFKCLKKAATILAGHHLAPLHMTLGMEQGMPTPCLLYHCPGDKSVYLMYMKSRETQALHFCDPGTDPSPLSPFHT